MSTNAVAGYDEKMNQRQKKKQPGAFLTLWLRKMFVSIKNYHPGLTWINVEQARPIFFYLVHSRAGLQSKMYSTYSTEDKLY